MNILYVYIILKTKLLYTGKFEYNSHKNYTVFNYYARGYTVHTIKIIIAYFKIKNSFSMSNFSLKSFHGLRKIIA